MELNMVREGDKPPQSRFTGLRGRSVSRGRNAKSNDTEKVDNRRSHTPNKRNFKFKKLLKSRSKVSSRSSPIPDARKLSSTSNSDAENVVITPKVRSADITKYEASDPQSPQTESTFTNNKRVHHDMERDGFCRRVDFYDGTTINVEGVPTYRVGNYLGGGVAGVVYEGHRLLPISEYPKRAEAQDYRTNRSNSILDGKIMQTNSDEIKNGCAGIFCGPSGSDRNSDPTYYLNDELNAETCTTSDDLENDLIHDETVAIKILNPIGFRLTSPSQCESAIILKKGLDMDEDIKKGLKPMTANHVWWMINPSSRSAKAARSGKDGTLSLKTQGTKEHGLKLSVIAGYVDPEKKSLAELPLTRCIEIWGHFPFESSEEEFESVMDAIERLNGGHSLDESEETRNPAAVSFPNDANPNIGLRRAANAEKLVEFCKDLNAFVNIPVVPPRYVRWLRQRRAVTKEIRNMTRIGRHKNVVHLFEVLELVQDSKSTMFLVLELVKGGELFDLISSNAATTNISHDELVHLNDSERNEYAMQKFFKELTAGIAYCHANGIAHRDLKPENLLVHHDTNGSSILKIADFGLSSTFASNQGTDSNAGGSNSTFKQDESMNRSSASGLPPIFETKLTLQSIGKGALSLLTCGGVEQINECFVPYHKEPGSIQAVNRMTSIVGSPHYVAPEIISQSDERKSISSASNQSRGYDGTKADIWSAGVILYAMLFRSLPFGEDLLRCPRYQSFAKWYREARKLGGRRSSAAAALRPVDAEKNKTDLGPHWFFPSRSSAESKDIIVAMLNPDPVERLNIQQVKAHPWMALRFDVTIT
jgi:Serine/threonine protein kinase